MKDVVFVLGGEPVLGGTVFFFFSFRYFLYCLSRLFGGGGDLVADPSCLRLEIFCFSPRWSSLAVRIFFRGALFSFLFFVFSSFLFLDLLYIIFFFL